MTPAATAESTLDLMENLAVMIGLLLKLAVNTLRSGPPPMRDRDGAAIASRSSVALLGRRFGQSRAGLPAGRRRQRRVRPRPGQARTGDYPMETGSSNRASAAPAR